MKWENKKVLITGGAGFLGSHLVDMLSRLKAEITIVDSVNMDESVNLENTLESVTYYPSFDISEPNAFSKLNEDFDYIFHLAALANPKDCEKNAPLAFRVNVQGTINVLEFARGNNLKKFIFVSSAQLYGRYPKYLPIDEQHPLDGSGSVYNLSKKTGEELCQLYQESYDMPVIFFRLFNSFGPRQRNDYFIPTVIREALEKNEVTLWSEKPTRDFTYVSDTINAIIRGAEVSYIGGPINIGSGNEIVIGDACRKIASKFKVNVNFRNEPVTGAMRMCCDNSKARKLLGWKPEVSFEQGLHETITWYKSNRDRN